MPRSLFSIRSQTEPLPAYSRDPESGSVRSSAPSYTSDTPSYTSRRLSQRSGRSALQSSSRRPTATSNDTQISRHIQPEDEAVPLGLPAVQFAPGFGPRSRPNLSSPERHSYNMNEWSNTSTAHSNRQIDAVARRRASRAVLSISSANVIASLAVDPVPTSSSTTCTPAIVSAPSGPKPPSADSPPSTASNVPAMLPPLEDPELVGEAAASQARQQRIYREICAGDDEAIRHEGKTWDFMLSQMSDWEDRERSWNGYQGRFVGYGFGIGAGRTHAQAPKRKVLGLKGRLAGWSGLGTLR